MASCGHSGLAFDDGGRCYRCTKVAAGLMESGESKSKQQRELVQVTQFDKWKKDGKKESRRRTGETWEWRAS